ncbi:MAG TPA: phosphoribosylglycinamide formyltransferase [Parvibaculum sp.]|uniref:phosphoribosylglycinamide formyltransferase n=1 Tax=Parvibaculum sp. TaxID=2024848 RepID=UPI002BA81F6D|nr:phosphoribosylglycinamide formyltransferase [Parvibaculum sp.]HMM14641.1 phosphoribosylglycinamide formyltransferase [Parvibaculum sp.]
MRVGVLISGRGSNLASLIEAAKAADYPAEIVTVISNKADAGGIAIARNAGIPAEIISHRDYPSREAFDAALDATLRRAGVDLVCNAGFMRILSDGFVDAWRDRQLNIHPSLLPAFKGLHVHERVLEAGCRITGCTVHFVRPAMDEGPIVAQAAVPVIPGDTVDRLADRVLAAEHRLYPMALRLVAEGRTRIVDERVLIDGEDAGAQAPLFVPAGH